jgi:hypothetical protein
VEPPRSANSPLNSASHSERFITFCDPRNDDDYDTFEYGTEPIPGDTHWVKVRTLTQLYRHLIYVFATSETICSSKLAGAAIHEILKLRLTDLTRLKHQDPNFFA